MAVAHERLGEAAGVEVGAALPCGVVHNHDDVKRSPHASLPPSRSASWVDCRVLDACWVQTVWNAAGSRARWCRYP